METSSLPPPMSLLIVVIFKVSKSETSSFTGIKPSATTVALSRVFNMSFLLTSIEKIVSLGKRFPYSGKVPSSFLIEAENLLS